jgi:uncharacterized protein YbjT (DUF2867 family)
MALQVVVGAGPVGSATARLFADQGDEVRIVSRRGGGPEHPRIERVSADATDTATLAEVAIGAATVLNCAMPPYDRWPEEFPPISSSLLQAAERAGARYLIVGNGYGYAPSTEPIRADEPLAP